MPLFGARPPVEDRERQWIEKMLTWCVEHFGREAFEAEVLTPTPSFFPGTYRGTPDDVLELVDLVRAHLRIDPAEIAIVSYDGRPPARPSPPCGGTNRGAPGAGAGQQSIAGHYSVRNGLGLIAIGLDNAPDPRRVVAVAAHELCHHKLLYRGLASTAERDHEPLTDLATVFFGLGVFTANAAYTFAQGSATSTSRCSATRWPASPGCAANAIRSGHGTWTRTRAGTSSRRCATWRRNHRPSNPHSASSNTRSQIYANHPMSDMHPSWSIEASRESPAAARHKSETQADGPTNRDADRAHRTPAGEPPPRPR
jgi:hypothetical protein